MPGPRGDTALMRARPLQQRVSSGKRARRELKVGQTKSERMCPKYFIKTLIQFRFIDVSLACLSISIKYVYFCACKRWILMKHQREDWAQTATPEYLFQTYRCWIIKCLAVWRLVHYDEYRYGGAVGGKQSLGQLSASLLTFRPGALFVPQQRHRGNGWLVSPAIDSFKWSYSKPQTHSVMKVSLRNDTD